MKRKAATKKQQQWQDFQRELGCAACGKPACIHHAVGASARHHKVEIGQWWTVPLCPEHHQGQSGIHGDRALFGERRRQDIEKHLFQWTLTKAVNKGHPLPPQEVISAIEGYSR